MRSSASRLEVVNSRQYPTQNQSARTVKPTANGRPSIQSWSLPTRSRQETSGSGSCVLAASHGVHRPGSVGAIMFLNHRAVEHASTRFNFAPSVGFSRLPFCLQIHRVETVTHNHPFSRLQSASFLASAALHTETKNNYRLLSRSPLFLAINSI